jgi:hypothetical protein
MLKWPPAGRQCLPSIPLWRVCRISSRGQDPDTLALIARNGSKPGRTGETFILHATPQWSRAQIESDRDAVKSAMVDAFRAQTDLKGSLPAPIHCEVHRWLYALVETALGATLSRQSGQHPVCLRRLVHRRPCRSGAPVRRGSGPAHHNLVSGVRRTKRLYGNKHSFLTERSDERSARIHPRGPYSRDSSDRLPRCRQDNIAQPHPVRTRMASATRSLSTSSVKSASTTI